MLIRFTSHDFVAGKLNRAGLIVVMFYADWCPFCMVFKPQFEKFAEKCNADCGEYNISHYEDPLWEQFQIKVVPSVLVFKDGELAKRKDGRLFRGLHNSDLDELMNGLSSTQTR